jgi:hypothetical protein
MIYYDLSFYCGLFLIRVGPLLKESVFSSLLIPLWSSYSRVHISSDEVFSKILKKPSIVQKKMIPHMNAFGLFNKIKKKKKKKI